MRKVKKETSANHKVALCTIIKSDTTNNRKREAYNPKEADSEKNQQLPFCRFVMGGNVCFGIGDAE